MISFLIEDRIVDQELLQAVQKYYEKTRFYQIAVAQEGMAFGLELADKRYEVELKLFKNRLSGHCSCQSRSLCIHAALAYEKYRRLALKSLPYFYTEDTDLYLSLSDDRNLLLRYYSQDPNLLELIKEGKKLDDHTVELKGKAIERLIAALPKLREHFRIQVDDRLKTKKASKSNFRIKAGIKNELLAISFEAEGIDKTELKEILASYRLRKQFHVLKDGRTLILDHQQLKEVDELLTELQIADDQLTEPIALAKNRIFVLENSKLEIERSSAYRQMLKAVDQQDLNKIEAPAIYGNILREYQLFGYRWLKAMSNYGFGAILADDMGLGKTLQMLAYLESNRGNHCSLVVAPASLVYNWANELVKFGSALKTACVVGSVEQRELLLRKAADYDLLITSYDYLRRDSDLYRSSEFQSLILDEAQYIKNQQTQNAKAVKQIKAKQRFAMSGTPIENNLQELWSLFDFIMPSYLGSYNEFLKKYEQPILAGDKQKAQKLKQLVAPFILRRKKEEVLKELPPKIEETHLIDFTQDEARIYQAYALRAVKQLDGADHIHILAAMNQLRQLCLDPRLLFAELTEISSKMAFALSLIEKIVAAKEKVLLFSSFTSLLTLMEPELNKRAIGYLKLTGANSKEERKELVERFKQEDQSLFLISLKAGGTGLNLTAANHVIHFDPWWNSAATAQASDRTYRIGQNKTVVVHYLIMKDSIEEKIQQLQLAKKDLAASFIEGNSGVIAQMSKEELLELFK